MSLAELLTGGGGILLVVLTLIQITPLKVNPWTWLAKRLGTALTGDVVKQMQEMEQTMEHMRVQLEYVKLEAEEQAAINARSRILRFGDELLHDVRHTKDHWDHTLRDIDVYNEYCRANPDFPNHVTDLTAKRIEEGYLRALETNDFL